MRRVIGRLAVVTALVLGGTVAATTQAQAAVQAQCWPLGTSNPANLWAHGDLWNYSALGNPQYRILADLDEAGSGWRADWVRVREYPSGSWDQWSTWQNPPAYFAWGNYTGYTQYQVQGRWRRGDENTEYKTCSVILSLRT